MRPAAATIWKYLLEREQSPEGAPLFMKFYVGCWERNREREREGEKRKEKKKWVKRRKETTETGRMEGGVRTWSDSGWKKGVGGVEKEKMPDEKEQRGRKHVRWLSGCRAKNTSYRGEWCVFSQGIQLGRYLSWISYLVPSSYIYNGHLEIW